MHEHSCFHLLAKLPSAAERHVTEATWQRVAQCGAAWHGAESRGFLLLRCVWVPPGTQCGGKLSLITHACECQWRLANFIIRAHVTQELTKKKENKWSRHAFLQRNNKKKSAAANAPKHGATGTCLELSHNRVNEEVAANWCYVSVLAAAATNQCAHVFGLSSTKVTITLSEAMHTNVTHVTGRLWRVSSRQHSDVLHPQLFTFIL